MSFFPASKIDPAKLLLSATASLCFWAQRAAAQSYTGGGFIPAPTNPDGIPIVLGIVGGAAAVYCIAKFCCGCSTGQHQQYGLREQLIDQRASDVRAGIV